MTQLRLWQLHALATGSLKLLPQRLFHIKNLVEQSNKYKEVSNNNEHAIPSDMAFAVICEIVK